MNKVVHPVTSVTFVVGLKYFADDETIVKFILTEDNKQIFYLDFVGNTLTNHGCESNNVLVDVPKAKYDLVHPHKTCYPKEC